MKRIAFIINPASGIGGKASLARSINSFLFQNRGWAGELCHTIGPNDAFNKALRCKEESFDLVVAVGGDGTVNEVARALVHSSVPMGIIPAGSGNGLARHLKIPLSVQKAVNLLYDPHVISIDSGAINGYSFFCTAGIGFEANLTNRFNKAHVRGLPSYLALSALEYAYYRPEKYKIYVGDQVFEREAFLITFANCAQWGNNIYIAPGASATDGLLDMVIWKKMPKAGVLFTATRLLTRNIDQSQYIEHIRGTSFRIERMNEGYVQFDGESEEMGKEIKIEVFPASLKVVTSRLFQ